MRRFVLVLFTLSIFVLVMGVGCHKPPKQTEEVKPVETTPPPAPAPAPPPEVKPTPEVKKVTESDFKAIYFNFDKYDLVDSAQKALDLNANILKENPNVVIRIEGNCDERGTVEYNLALGEKRAMSAKKYMTDLGIADNRLQTISYGKERPLNPGHDESAWAKNRRDDFKIISQ